MDSKGLLHNLWDCVGALALGIHHHAVDANGCYITHSNGLVQTSSIFRSAHELPPTVREVTQQVFQTLTLLVEPGQEYGE